MSDELEGLRAELLRAARIEQPPSDLEERIARRLENEPARPPRRLFTPARAAAGGLALLLGAAGYALSRSHPVEVATPEPPRPSVAAPSAKQAPPVTDAPRACLVRGRGSGREPLIDDFEDGNGDVLARDGRHGPWQVVTDRNDKTKGPFTTLPSKSGNGHALHFTGPEFREWGSSLEYSFPTHCYDASAYRGLSFRAKGPGRVYVSAREVSVVPEELDGTCRSDCYNSHVKLIVLGEKWQRIELAWSDLQQRGYGRPDVDVSSLHSLQFSVRPEDTPFDLWIDDVAFLER
jgi:hypothetical protein